MPERSITFTDQSDLPLVMLSYAPIPGVETARQVMRVWNDIGGPLGSDDWVGAQFIPTARPKGATGTPFAGSGFTVLDSHSVLVAIVGSNDPTIHLRAAQGTGPGAALEIPVLASDVYVDLEISIKLPGTALAPAPVDISPAFDEAPSFPVGGYAKNRILTGEGEGGVSYLADLDGAISASGPADDTVTVPDSAWMRLGKTSFQAETAFVFDDLDGSAAALVAFTSYAAALTLGNGSITVTKGDQEASGLTVDALPTLPEDEELLAWVEVPFGLVIDQSLIHLVAVEGLFSASFDLLDLTVGPGRCLSNDFQVRTESDRIAPVDDDATSIVYMDGAGSLIALEESESPAGRPLALYHVVAAGGVITDVSALAAPGF